MNLLPASTLSLDVRRGRDEAQGPEKGQAAPEMLGEQRKCGFRLPVNASVLCRAASLQKSVTRSSLPLPPPAHSVAYVIVSSASLT